MKFTLPYFVRPNHTNSFNESTSYSLDVAGVAFNDREFASGN